MPPASLIPTLTLLTEHGTQRVPPDSMAGSPYRPFAQGTAGGRIAGLEGLYDFFINDVPDPDEALRLDPEFHTRLRQHPVVAADMRKREGSVSMMPDHIEPNPNAPDKQLAKLVSEYCQWRWEMLPDRRKMYQHLQSAILVGGCGGEFVWHKDADGTEWPTKFLPMHKSRFCRDRLGNLALKMREFPVYGVYVQPNPQDGYVKYFPPGKFIYHVYRAEPGYWERPELEGYIYWGIGEDVPLYYPVTFDQFAWRLHMKLLEKYGMPPTVVYYPENMPEYVPKAKRIGGSLRGETVISAPRIMSQAFDSLFKIEQLPVPTMSFDMFERFHDLVARLIDNLLLGSAEEMQRSQRGAASEQEIRKESGPEVKYGEDAQNISDTITTQVLPAMALSRWPTLPPAYWPVHKLEPKEERDPKAEAENAKLVGSMVPLDKDEVYERTGWRKPADPNNTVFFGQVGFDDGFDMAPPMAVPGAIHKPVVSKPEEELVHA